MEEKSIQLEDQEPTPKLGSGALLSAARKQQKKSVEDIAKELNLSISQIKTIELDQSEGLPEPTYVRGYIRSYANLLGLNPDEILEHYLNKNWQKSANLDDLPRGLRESDSSDGSLFTPARVIAFLVLAGGISFLIYSGWLNSFFGQSGSSATNVGNSAELSPVIQVTENQPNSAQSEELSLTDAQSNEDASSLSNESDENSETNGSDLDADEADLSANEGRDTSSDDSDSGSANSLENKVVLSFSETSWVDIRDESQDRLAFQTYAAGDVMEVSAEGVLSILLGNAKGVAMTLNGQDYDLTGHTEGVYAKFTVGTPKQLDN